MRKQTKYEINLDKPLMLFSYVVIAYMMVRAFTNKDLFELILFSTFFIALTLIVMRDSKTWKPVFVKVKSKTSAI